MVNNRQFYISTDKTSFFSGWASKQLSCGVTIHYQPDLHTLFIGDSIALLGHAWQTDPSRNAPSQELIHLVQQATITHKDVYEIEHTWCGRYVLIVNDWLYLDATGSLNVYYSSQYISSSLNVLCHLQQLPVVYPPILQKGKVPDSYLGMRTPYTEISHLLPSQIINIATHKTIIRPLLAKPIPECTSDECVSLFVKYFSHSLQNLEQEFAKHDIWLALTAGRDSRPVLALLDKVKVKYRTFTLWHPRIPYADSVLPRRLSRAIKKDYRFIKRHSSAFSQQRYDEFQAHTAGMSVDEDWDFYAYNQYPALKQGDTPIVILRSGICANEFYNRYGEICLSDITSVLPGIKLDENLKQSAIEWQEYVKHDNINTNISLAIRMYWELREGCWLSAIEQSFDVMDGISSIQVYNSRQIIGILLGFPYEERLYKKNEEKITETVNPRLAKIPYDYQFNDMPRQRLRRWFIMLPERIRRRVKRYLS